MSLPLYRRRVLPGGRAAHEKFCQESYACAEAFLQIDSNSKQTLILFFLPEINQMITYYDTEYTQKEEDNCKRKKKTNKSKNDRKDQISKKKKKKRKKKS
mgnify:CR=1 FL=1